MNSILVFVRKEIKEQMRSYKILILIAVLLLFGIMSPLLAQLTPELLKGMNLGENIIFYEPTYLDAYTQFFKNMTSMVIVILILVYSGAISQEKSKGTLILMLTKHISRTSLIISKFISMVLLWSVAYVIASFSFLYYTYVLFPDLKWANSFAVLFAMWLFVILIIAITLLASTFSANPYIGTIGAFVGWFSLMMTAYVPWMGRYSPITLSTWNMKVLQGLKDPSDLVVPSIICTLLCLCILVLTCQLFKRQEI